MGPKIAIAVLGALPAAELGVTRRGQARPLRAHGGVRRGQADRRAHASRFPRQAPGGRGAASATAADAMGAMGASRRGEGTGEERLKSALTGMGFKPAEAERAESQR